jgi:hypothetical protein
VFGQVNRAGPLPGARPTWYLTHEYLGRDRTCDLQELQVAPLTVPLFLEGRLGGVSAPEEREPNWYPVSQVGWFTAHIREGIAVAGHQLELLQPALARPGRLDDATVARIIGVHQDQAGDLVYFQHQADKWKALPGLTAAQRAAVAGYEAALARLRQVNSDVLAAAGQLTGTTIGAVLAKSDLELGLEALLRGWQ